MDEHEVEAAEKLRRWILGFNGGNIRLIGQATFELTETTGLPDSRRTVTIIVTNNNGTLLFDKPHKDF